MHTLISLSESKKNIGQALLLTTDLQLPVPPNRRGTVQRSLLQKHQLHQKKATGDEMQIMEEI